MQDDSGSEGQAYEGNGSPVGATPGSPVGQRTRARNPLGGVTLEELEAMLQVGPALLGPDSCMTPSLKAVASRLKLEQLWCLEPCHLMARPW